MNEGYQLALRRYEIAFERALDETVAASRRAGDEPGP